MRELLWKDKSWVYGWLWPDTATWGQIQDQAYIFCIGKVLHVDGKLVCHISVEEVQCFITLILTIKSIVNKNRRLIKGLPYFPLSPPKAHGITQVSLVVLAVQVILHWVKKSAFLEKKHEVLKHAFFSVYSFWEFSTLLREPRNHISCWICGAYLSNCCRS